MSTTEESEYKMKIEIKNRYSNNVLFAHEAEENSLSITLLAALKAGADLRGADLRGANLRGVNLYGADLRGVNLYVANLGGADLRGADLRGVNLYGADLRGANLYDANLGGANLYDANLGGADLGGADLRDANLCDKKLIGTRPFFQCGPIGSRSDYLLAFLTDAGVMLTTGCFHGTVAEFEEKLAAEHEMNDHAIEYYAALKMIEVHAKLWTPKEPK
jgi:hypothetical protein